MKIVLLEGAPRPPEHALIVCAGTVTCSTVQEMASGFSLFKQYFDQDLPSNTESEKGWIASFNQHLTGYKYGRKLPLYCQIARQDTYIGGIATVACIQGQYAISPTHQKLSQSSLEEQYKSAVREAVKDAIQLQRPLYIQPLGIGVYGWHPSLAATLFGEVLAEFQTTAIDIHIPIYDQADHSADRQFAEKLQADIDKGLQAKVRTARAPAPPRRINQTHAEWIMLLKFRLVIWNSLARLTGVLSALFIIAAGLALFSIITATSLTTGILGVTGLGLGLASCMLFRRAKEESNHINEQLALSNRR